MNTLLTEMKTSNDSTAQILLNLNAVVAFQEIPSYCKEDDRETSVLLTNEKTIIIKEYFSDIVDMLHDTEKEETKEEQYVSKHYQINYIDADGLASTIDTFEIDEYDKAVETLYTLNKANCCINKDTKYVLDLVGNLDEFYSETITKNITNEKTISELCNTTKN